MTIPPMSSDTRGVGCDLWSDDLTDAQLRMVIDSGDKAFGRTGSGAGVELIGSSAWRVARSLVAKGLGSIEGGAPNGSDFPGLYFNNEEGARIVGEFEDNPDD